MVKGDAGTSYVNMLAVVVFRFLFKCFFLVFDVFCVGVSGTILSI